ncbi:N-lysine methyltransferase [Acrasis kona]|uniref:N-lysine methyltransferase n=1 Tax=Acrasis kona TaxID=1008807 RepID=A0AAW2ZDG0_9EUKA
MDIGCPCCNVKSVRVASYVKDHDVKQGASFRAFFNDLTLTPEKFSQYKSNLDKHGKHKVGSSSDTITIKPFSPDVPKTTKTPWPQQELKPFNVAISNMDCMIQFYQAAESHYKIPRHLFTLYKSSIRINPSLLNDSYQLKSGDTLSMVLNQEYDEIRYNRSVPVPTNKQSLQQSFKQLKITHDASLQVKDGNWKDFCFKTFNLPSGQITTTNGSDHQWKEYYKNRIKCELFHYKLMEQDVNKLTKSDEKTTCEHLRHYVNRCLKKQGRYLQRKNTFEESHLDDIHKRIVDACYCYKFQPNRVIMGDLMSADWFCRFYSPIRPGNSIDLIFHFDQQSGWSTITFDNFVTYKLITIQDDQNISTQSPDKNRSKCVFTQWYDNDEKCNREITKVQISDQELQNVKQFLFGEELDFSNRRMILLIVEMACVNASNIDVHDPAYEIISNVIKNKENSEESDEEEESNAQKINCGCCGKSEKLMKCSGCKREFYCSQECQKKMWALHKQVCGFYKKWNKN